MCDTPNTQRISTGGGISAGGDVSAILHPSTPHYTHSTHIYTPLHPFYTHLWPFYTHPIYNSQTLRHITYNMSYTIRIHPVSQVKVEGEASTISVKPDNLEVVHTPHENVGHGDAQVTTHEHS